jgi:hypothetical protein
LALLVLESSDATYHASEMASGCDLQETMASQGGAQLQPCVKACVEMEKKECCHFRFPMMRYCRHCLRCDCQSSALILAWRWPEVQLMQQQKETLGLK